MYRTICFCDKKNTITNTNGLVTFKSYKKHKIDKSKFIQLSQFLGKCRAKKRQKGKKAPTNSFMTFYQIE